MKFKYPEGATPLDTEEVEGLIPLQISTQGQLNAYEAANILDAENWLFSSSHRGNFLTLDFVKLLHKKMFQNTWRWAGKFRRSDKNIGIPWSNISVDLKNLLDDVMYQIQNTVYPIDEITYRFHHRLVFIHPFPNGNGRHARMMTDFLLVQANTSRFSWGNTNLIDESMARTKYIQALREADKHNYQPLREFVRS